VVELQWKPLFWCDSSLIVEHAFAFLLIPKDIASIFYGVDAKSYVVFQSFMVALPRWEKRNQMQATPASGSSNFAGVAIFYVILPYSPFPYKDNLNP